MIEIPSSGLTLLRDQPTWDQPDNQDINHIIQLNIVENVTKDILKALRNNESVRLKLGKKPAVQYGKRSILLSHDDEALPSEIFSGPLDSKKPMYFSGKLSHTLEIQKAKEATAKSDEALVALENTLKSMQEQRASNEANLVKAETSLLKARDPGRQDLKQTSASSSRFFASTPSSPFLSAGRSPGNVATSAPLLSATSSKDKIRLDAMKVPMVHLLALGPMSTDKMAKTLNIPRDECEKALDKVSREVNGQRELKEKSYRDLEVWKFPYASNEDRQKAIDHAVQAYDRMRIEKHDHLWQQLLPKDKRGKGTFLTRLNFPKLIPTPKPATTTEKDVKADASDRESKLKKQKTVKDVPPKKKANDNIPTGLPISKPKAIKPPAKAPTKQSKPEPKFKSSERIEDSDEEAEAASRSTVRNSLMVSKVKDRQPESHAIKAVAGKVPVHKSRLSESSSVSSDIDRPRKVAERELPKTRARIDMNQAKKSPRPRADSLPPKTSPLNSSPPANSVDADDSSKASTQSSAPSSPPSSNDVPLAQQRRTYSPVVSSRSRGQPLSPPKRKAEKSGDEPPPKKQQVNGDRLNSLPKGLTSQLQHPTPERRSSGSSASSPSKSRISKHEVIAAAKNFNLCYGKYRDLHEKLSRLSSKDREDKDIDNLWKMHKRLEEMKSEIWADWDRVAGSD